jgi:hypothetical protein
MEEKCQVRPGKWRKSNEISIFNPISWTIFCTTYTEVLSHVAFVFHSPSKFCNMFEGQ